jgi:hypothetical protein
MQKITRNTLKDLIRTQLSREMEKSYFICCRNSVKDEMNSDVRNVLVIVAISQKDPLQEFNA